MTGWGHTAIFLAALLHTGMVLAEDTASPKPEATPASSEKTDARIGAQFLDTQPVTDAPDKPVTTPGLTLTF